MAHFKKENDLPKSKITASSLSKATIIFKYASGHRWKFYVGLVFLLLTGATALAFPKLTNKDTLKKEKMDCKNNIPINNKAMLLTWE